MSLWMDSYVQTATQLDYIHRVTIGTRKACGFGTIVSLNFVQFGHDTILVCEANSNRNRNYQQAFQYRDPLWTETPWTETPWTETASGQRPLDRDPGQRPLDRDHPWTETPLTETLGRDPLDRDAWTETIPGQRPPRQRSPGQRPFLDRDHSWTEAIPGKRPPGQKPPGQRAFLDRDPLDRDHPWTQAIPGHTPPRQRPLGQRSSLDRDHPWTETLWIDSWDYRNRRPPSWYHVPKQPVQEVISYRDTPTAWTNRHLWKWTQNPVWTIPNSSIQKNGNFPHDHTVSSSGNRT